ncbi:MAG: redoxin domain-containing protein [Alphaproteobacteria bacterium]|nr:redoxin domain-containing protein [Alphaproteobacteria bacterium]
MLKKLSLFLGALFCLSLSQPAFAAADIGKIAPDFEGVNVLTGETVKLSDLKGKTVVLEWTNHECPYVKKHYESGNMQKTQKTAKDEYGVEWVTIVSSADGHQGHISADQAKKIVEEAGASPDVKILDESGSIGKMYDAQTTPHMFIIDSEGFLVYKGAIDSDSSPRPETIDGATNYVLTSLAEMKAGEPVKTASTQPYGCGVKY